MNNPPWYHRFRLSRSPSAPTPKQASRIDGMPPAKRPSTASPADAKQSSPLRAARAARATWQGTAGQSGHGWAAEEQMGSAQEAHRNQVPQAAAEQTQSSAGMQRGNGWAAAARMGAARGEGKTDAHRPYAPTQGAESAAAAPVRGTTGQTAASRQPQAQRAAAHENEANGAVLRRSRIVRWAAGGLLVLMLAGTAATALWVRGLDISKLAHPLPEPSFVLDAEGQTMSQLSSSQMVPVAFSEMAPALRSAIVAVEDQRFYEHAGYDLRAIGRALYRDVQTGSFAEGGSTITQQLAKNMFLASDKTLVRKAKEMGYAVKISFTYSKDQILEMYLNSIYFGEGQWGVEGAARHYFGKPAKQLSLAEAAMLAGLPKAPSAYSPVRHPDKALERRNLVLSLMNAQQFITEAEYAAAAAEPLALKPDEQATLKGRYPSYVDYVMDEAEQRYGFSEEDILTRGLRIQTAMDAKAQQTAEDVYANAALFPQSPDGQLAQSAFALLDPRTGGIKALVGGRGPQVYRGFNRATELKRQPGSTFKPLAVYGPALEKGYSPDAMLYDGELDIGGYRPRDWDGRTRGEVTMREAVTRSWNIPAVWLLNEIGIQAGLDFVRRAGIALPEGDRTLSLALGGLSEGVSPLQMAQAFGALGNQGVLQQAHAITRITTKEGGVLVDAPDRASTVTTPSVAYYVTSLLQEAVASGTGKAAALTGRPTAGKTGTTQLPATPEFEGIGSGSAKDAWFVGYTPELAAAVWLGYDKTDKMHYLTTSGGSMPAVIFQEIMSRVLNGTPVTDFSVPEEIRLAQEEAQRREDAERERRETQRQQEAERAREQQRRTLDELRPKLPKNGNDLRKWLQQFEHQEGERPQDKRQPKKSDKAKEQQRGE